MRTLASITLAATTVSLVTCEREHVSHRGAKLSESLGGEPVLVGFGIRLSKPGDVPFVWADPDGPELERLLECLKEESIYLAIGSDLHLGMATFGIAPDDWDDAQRIVDAKGLRHSLKFEERDPQGPQSP